MLGGCGLTPMHFATSALDVGRSLHRSALGRGVDERKHALISPSWATTLMPGGPSLSRLWLVGSLGRRRKLGTPRGINGAAGRDVWLSIRFRACGRKACFVRTRKRGRSHDGSNGSLLTAARRFFEQPFVVWKLPFV
jgi:hypothetical protein